MRPIDDGAVGGMEESIRRALRDAEVSTCSIMVRSSTNVLHEVVAVPVCSSPLRWVIGGHGFRLDGLSEEGAMEAILQVGVPVSIAISRPRT